MQESCIENVREMQDVHLSWDFGDIGFNFVIGNDGNVYEGRIMSKFLIDKFSKMLIFKELDGIFVVHIQKVII